MQDAISKDVILSTGSLMTFHRTRLLHLTRSGIPQLCHFEYINSHVLKTFNGGK